MVDSYMSTNKIPVLSLAIIQNDSVKTLKVYGLSSTQHDAKVDVNTTFTSRQAGLSLTGTPDTSFTRAGPVSF
jgi:hypothetical protein